MHNVRDAIKDYMINKGICKAYALKFARTETIEDLMTLGIDLQATPFICHLINQNVLKSDEIFEQCERFINGKATFKREISNDVYYNGRYYVKYNNKQITNITNSLLVIDCSNLHIFVTRFYAPIINIVGGSSVIIDTEENSVININLYDENSTLKLNKIHKSTIVHVHRINCMNSNIDYDSNNQNIIIHEPKIKDIYD